MKIKTYPLKRERYTTYIQVGSAVDSDLQGGLEEIMLREIEQGCRRIVLNLRGMHFLHSTLFAGLLNTWIHLQRVDGELVLAGAPWFLRVAMGWFGLESRFLWLNNPLVVRTTGLNSAIMAEGALTENGKRAEQEKLTRIIG